MHSNLVLNSWNFWKQSSKNFNIIKHWRHCSSSINQQKSAYTSTTRLSAKNVEKSSDTIGVTIKSNSIAYGQPTPLTHPHLLKTGELVPGIKVAEFQKRRQLLMESIQSNRLDSAKKIQNHVVIIPSSTKKFMSDKIPYVFRQNSDFFYLSGCMEIDTVLVLWIDDTKQSKAAMFIRPKDSHAELWDGPRTGVVNARQLFNVDETYADTELNDFLQNFQKKYLLWYDSKQSDQPIVTKIVQNFSNKINQNMMESPIEYIQKLRLIKSSAEMYLMRQTCQIAASAINQTIAESRPGDSEHHLFARVDYHCRMNNASYLAYPPVVASGNNATTIHYINNSQISNNGDLLLMDAGCEYGGYTSDITRTWPINGNFSSVQRLLYEVLFTVQKELIACIMLDDGRTLNGLFDTMCKKLGKYLQEIGLIGRELSGIELIKSAYSFCPHHVSHYLGMDVHDTPLLTRNIPLTAGMVFTIEPGIYIAANRSDVPSEFRGIGMRIEDDILITERKTVEVLTESCVKDPNMLEKLIQT